MVKTQQYTEIGLPKIVEETEWQQALADLLIKEKAARRARGALAAERRRLPMVRDSPAGRPQAAPYTWWRRHDEYANDSGGNH